MNEVTETIEDSVETGEEDPTALDIVLACTIPVLVGAVAAVGLPRLYRRIKNRKNVEFESIETTSREV